MVRELKVFFAICITNNTPSTTNPNKDESFPIVTLDLISKEFVLFSIMKTVDKFTSDISI